MLKPTGHIPEIRLIPVGFVLSAIYYKNYYKAVYASPAPSDAKREQP